MISAIHLNVKTINAHKSVQHIRIVKQYVQQIKNALTTLPDVDYCTFAIFFRF